MTPRALILRAPGINRDEDAAAAIELAGGRPERVHINRVVEGATKLADYALLIIPGGFSYGDHLGAGKLLAVDLAHRLGEALAAFVADGRPVIGICNGFQVLVKAGILPGMDDGRRTNDERSRTTSISIRPSSFVLRPHRDAHRQRLRPVRMPLGSARRRSRQPLCVHAGL